MLVSLLSWSEILYNPALEDSWNLYGHFLTTFACLSNFSTTLLTNPKSEFNSKLTNWVFINIKFSTPWIVVYFKIKKISHWAVNCFSSSNFHFHFLFSLSKFYVQLSILIFNFDLKFSILFFNVRFQFWFSLWFSILIFNFQFQLIISTDKFNLTSWGWARPSSATAVLSL